MSCDQPRLTSCIRLNNFKQTISVNNTLVAVGQGMPDIVASFQGWIRTSKVSANEQQGGRDTHFELHPRGQRPGVRSQTSVNDWLNSRTDEVDGLGEDLKKLEAEESDIVKEPEGPREDSSLKRGASKISRALVCQITWFLNNYQIECPCKSFRTHWDCSKMGRDVTRERSRPLMDLTDVVF